MRYKVQVLTWLQSSWLSPLTGPVKWFRFQNLNSFCVSLNLPNLSVKRFPGCWKRKQTKWAFVSHQWKQSAWRGACCAIFVLWPWRVAKDKQRRSPVVNNRVQRSGLVAPDLDAREGRFRIRIQNLGGTWMVSGPPSSRPLILHSPESSSAWAKDCGAFVLLLTGVEASLCVGLAVPSFHCARLRLLVSWVLKAEGRLLSAASFGWEDTLCAL